jgi:hypothetical protein
MRGVFDDDVDFEQRKSSEDAEFKIGRAHV